MTLILGNLRVTGLSTSLHYGTDDNFVYLTPGSSLPPGLSPADYDLLTCWTAELSPPIDEDPNPLDPKPTRLICGGICKRCTQSGCAGGPPPPYSIANQQSVMAVLKTLSFAGTRIAVPFTDPEPGVGPVYSGSYADEVPDLDQIAADVGAWLGPQDPPIIVHVYRLEDPNATSTSWHPLHKHIIGIPVPLYVNLNNPPVTPV